MDRTCYQGLEEINRHKLNSTQNACHFKGEGHTTDSHFQHPETFHRRRNVGRLAPASEGGEGTPGGCLLRPNTIAGFSQGIRKITSHEDQPGF
uniref:Uncharacterized protein n=1 Tax=Anguilla anguilla TaxID=7936 RepID=A0A0E9X1F7_ANGAN